MDDTDWRPASARTTPTSGAPNAGRGLNRNLSAEDGGCKADENKIRVELVAPEFVLGTAEALTFGAKKYADRNWERGMHWSRPFGAAMRHLWAWWGGKGPTAKSFLFGDLDEETGLSHLKHAACCLCFLITYEERGMTRFDDRFAGSGTVKSAKPEGDGR